MHSLHQASILNGEKNENINKSLGSVIVIQQGYIKLVKGDSKDLYNVTEDFKRIKEILKSFER